jgi:hypothetical protein
LLDSFVLHAQRFSILHLFSTHQNNAFSFECAHVSSFSQAPATGQMLRFAAPCSQQPGGPFCRYPGRESWLLDSFVLHAQRF